MKINLKRLDQNFNFEASNENGNTISIDASPDIGGHDKGMRPMQLLLAALGGCAAIDIILILKKQKQEIESFDIEVDGERIKNEGEEVSLYRTIDVHFILKGKIDLLKAERAVKLSMEKYCSVTKTLEPTAKINHRVTVN
ncbi:MAG: OsmC family protein [Bacteroidota bacterium]|jgi:putative redox protein